jgi:hypothetical protein
VDGLFVDLLVIGHFVADLCVLDIEGLSLHGLLLTQLDSFFVFGLEF